ncbi:hypothetical protein MMC26_000526 [Xylographa opegraphella]|nr:hypothetical protein [Xylographa opegraphella]
MPPPLRPLRLAPLPRSIVPVLVPNTPLAELEPLLTAHGGRWTLSADGKGLERNVRFGTFGRARVYNKTFIRLTTHRDRASGQSGISAQDLAFARFCDGAIGDDDVSADAVAGSSWGTELTARVAEEGREGVGGEGFCAAVGVMGRAWGGRVL